ncbi:MAG: formate dehydrogenase subunit gamma [Betaproteobacteria bacterium]
MYRNALTRWAAGLLAAFAFALPTPSMAADSSAKEQAQRQAVQPLNNAPVWRDVRSGEINPYQTTQVRGTETNVLIQTEGEVWRQIRNGPVTIYGGWLIVAFLAVLAAFFAVKGQIKLHDKPTGRLIERFNAWERILHWTTAISFVILAVSGIVLLFGKHLLLPLLGYTLFSWLSILSKNLHNFVGPLFVLCTVLMVFTFIKDNLPRAYDWLWVRKAGGLFTGQHVPSGRFNAGEKTWFWLGVTALGIVVSVTGVILDFPQLVDGARSAMQQASIIHAVAAVIFMAMSLGHIYLGTIGMEGAYGSMRSGYVDETWAKEHHEYWYRDATAKRTAPGAAPTAAAASPMKEGWKL